MKTLMMLIDAFSITYLNEEYTPLTYSIAKEGVVSSLKPLFAFRGIETTLFTGRWPDEHGIFAEMRYKTDSRISDILFEAVIRLIDLTHHDKIMKLSRVGGEFIFRGTRSSLSPNLIPAPALKYFLGSQQRLIYDLNGAKIPTIFDRLRENNIRFVYLTPSIINGDKGIVDRIEKMSRDDGIQFWYAKFTGFDREGHVHGPEPSMFKDKIALTELYIEKIIDMIGGIDNINLLIIADHGMSRVYKYIDMLEGLKSINGISIYKDYIPFLDSTLARFWFLNNNARNKIVEYLNALDFGHIVTEKERNDLRIPSDRAQIGDLMFVIDEGYAIYPDFWSGTRKVKGMHGYAYSITKESLPILVANKNMLRYYRDIPKYFVDIADGIIRSLISD